MAEPRRVPLLSVQSSHSSEHLASAQNKTNANGEASGEKADEEKLKSFRFEISLSTSNEKHCPEYSYVDLVKVKQGSEPCLKQEKKTGHGPCDSDGYDDDDELKALAKKFEDKYGPKQDNVKKGKKRKYSSNPYYYDIGYGYDESDPFVDNSEAYDELVPSNWTTQHGGFYINQGELHFRPMADSDLKDFKSPKKKRIIDGKKAKAKASDKNMSKTPKELSTQKRKKQLLSKEKKQKKLENAMASQKVKKRKMKRIIEDDSEDAPVLSQVKKPTKFNSPKSFNANAPRSLFNGTASQLDNSKSSEPSIKSQKPETKLFSHKENGSLNSFIEYQNDRVDLNNGVVDKKNQVSRDLKSESNIIQASPVGSSPNSSTAILKYEETPKDPRKDAETPSRNTEIPSSPPSLPENLPLILEAGIQNLKDAAANCQNGKCRFFDAAVNKTLLGVARSLIKLPCRVRTTVYDYLAFYLPCSKETLVKRAKTLMIEDQVNQLDAPMNQLKEAIEREMPHQKKLYDAEVANALTEQVREQMKQSGFSSKNNDEVDKTMSSVDEKNSTNTSEATTPSSEDKVKKNMPKRKFNWTEEIRKLLYDVVIVKVQLYKMLKSRSMTAEEYIKDFLENDVRKLWPKGWMTSRILFKESKSAHQDITQPASKAKKEKVSKKPEPLQVQRVHSSSNLEQPKLRHNSSFTTLVEAKGNTIDSADLTLKVSNKQESEAKLFTSNSSSVVGSLLKKSIDKSSEHHPKPGLNKDINAKDFPVKTESKTAVKLKQDIRMGASNKEKINPKALLSSSLKCNTTMSNVVITSPFERMCYTTSSTPQSSSLNFSKPNQQQIADVLKYDVSPAKPVSQAFEKPVHSILDYAAAVSGDLTGLKPPKVSSSPRSLSVVSATEAARKKLPQQSSPQKSSPMSKINSPLLQTQFSGQAQPRWSSHTQSTDEPVEFLSKSAGYGIPSKHVFHDVSSQSLIPSQHATQNVMQKPMYKTPPKEHHTSMSASSPKSSPQNNSPHGVPSASVSRTSPLIQYPSGIEQKRRLSGHSPEDVKHSHSGLSHSISRITREPSTQQASYTSLPYSNVISSLSNSMAIPKLQGAIQGLDQIHKINQQQQSLSAPTAMEMLFQQKQLHMKKQQLLQQQQQQQQQKQKQLQKHHQQNMQQQQQQHQQQQQQLLQQQQKQLHHQQQSMQQQHQQPEQQQQHQQLHAQPIQGGQGSTTSEQYPGPFSNYRPQYI